MFIALNDANERICGEDAERGQEYYCQQCGEKVFIKKGLIKTHHFAHYPYQSPCAWWEPESEEHLRMKLSILEILNKNNDIWFSAFEFGLIHNKLYPDVFCVLRNGKVIAIECQCSSKSLDYFIEKTQTYSDYGIYTLWLFPFREFYAEHICHRTSTIERQSHYWNYGRIYTLDLNTQEIVGVHFKKRSKTRKMFSTMVIDNTTLKAMCEDMETCHRTIGVLCVSGMWEML